MTQPRTLLDVLGDSIVNPRCDNCGTSLPTPRPDQIGLPRTCVTCDAIREVGFQARLRDFSSQERPRNRTIHRVKMWGTDGSNP